MSYEVKFDGVTQNWDSIKRSSFVDGTSMKLSEEGNMLQEIAKSKTLKSLRISENKFLKLVLKDQKYFVELIATGYKVTQLAGKTLQEAEKGYVDLFNEIF